MIFLQPRYSMTKQSYPTAFLQNWLYSQSLSYLEGKGIEKAPVAAFSLNTQAAELGHRDAVLAMGWFYLNGVGVEQNLDEAWYWYRKSARQGDPRAMFSLGYLCYIDRNYSGAYTWFSQASEAGHKRSLYWLGKLHWKGYGVEQNRKTAMGFFAAAAKAKVTEAKRVLCFLTRH